VRADTGPHFLDDSRGYLLAESPMPRGAEPST